jgi:hypothetical protein
MEAKLALHAFRSRLAEGTKDAAARIGLKLTIHEGKRWYLKSQKRFLCSKDSASVLAITLPWRSPYRAHSHSFRFGYSAWRLKAECRLLNNQWS